MSDQRKEQGMKRITMFDTIPCDDCNGQSGCDCDKCWGRGFTPSKTAIAVSNAILAKAKTLEGDDGTESDSDLCELLRVLDRVVRGKGIADAFGAPGDWGYDNPIGKALSDGYAQESESMSDDYDDYDDRDDDDGDDDDDDQFECITCRGEGTVNMCPDGICRIITCPDCDGRGRCP